MYTTTYGLHILLKYSKQFVRQKKKELSTREDKVDLQEQEDPLSPKLRHIKWSLSIQNTKVK